MSITIPLQHYKLTYPSLPLEEILKYLYTTAISRGTTIALDASGVTLQDDEIIELVQLIKENWGKNPTCFVAADTGQLRRTLKRVKQPLLNWHDFSTRNCDQLGNGARQEPIIVSSLINNPPMSVDDLDRIVGKKVTNLNNKLKSMEQKRFIISVAPGLYTVPKPGQQRLIVKIPN